MRTTVGHLRAIIEETKISASPEYMAKERVREALQGMISGMVASGQVADQAALDEAFAAFDMSVKALKMVPFEVWQRTAGTQGAARPKPVKKGRNR